MNPRHASRKGGVAILFFAAIFFALSATAAGFDEPVKATWITHPDAPPKGPVVLEFRRDFDLASVPAHAMVRVSADNRFILYVNGSRVGAGPARGDPAHWRCETYDLAPFLRAGHNHLGAMVWNWGGLAPMAQMTVQTGFLLEAENAQQSFLDSGPGWRVEIDPGFAAASPFMKMMKYGWYYAAGPFETIDATKRDWSWDDDQASGPAWRNAVPAVAPGSEAPWHLVPDPLPPMRYVSTDAGRVVRTGLPDASAFPTRPLTIAAHQKVRILLDHGAVFAAYPKLTVSGGTGAKIRLTYAEALYDQANRKGDRSAVDERQAIGLEDLFIPDGQPRRVFQPLWWRVWRFLEISVETNEQPVTLDALQASETGYPFDLKAHFESSDPELNRIWQIGWRTLALDSHETFMDTAYWEQLQYVGDARVEALIDYATTADPRLPLQAVTAIRDSRMADGITQSRYPSRSEQSIPTFSLLWIGMLHDYWMNVPDKKTIADSIPLVRSVLNWFVQYQLPNGLLRKVPDWNFVDWIKPEDRSFPSFGSDDVSCVTSLILLGALDEAADIEQSLGNQRQARSDRERGERVREAVLTACWDQSRGMMADTPDKKVFSQDGNALAALYGALPEGQAQTVLLKVAPPGAADAPEDVLPASYYFRFYLAQAYERAGLADRYLELLQPFRDLVKLHFTTWPEVRGETRSDSHAWSAHPTADLLRIVAGVEPSAPGSSAVRIEPHLGALTSVDATVPTPKGLVQVRYAVKDNALDAGLTVPEGLPATFVWRGKVIPLHAGSNELRLDARNGGN
jgi:hypothetical protein